MKSTGPSQSPSSLRSHLPELLSLLAQKRDELLAKTGKEVELHQIRQALERMREGTYGYCEECEGTIPMERLRMIPHARLCPTCLTELEHQQRGGRRR